MNRNPTILVIDDEQVILDSTQRALAAEGLVVLTAEDAETGLSTLRSDPPDIVITDLMLPGISGVEFLARARGHDPDLVVIVTTGYSTADNAVLSLKKGAFDFLPKPFAIDEILSSVRRALRYLQLPAAERKRLQPPGDDPPPHCLGLQTWARIDEDGAGTLGVTELFLNTIDRIHAIELPQAGHELRQGSRLARIATDAGVLHQVWSPLSGTVLLINEQLRRNPDLPHQNPVDGGWLVRIEPTNPDGDLANLDHRIH